MTELTPKREVKALGEVVAKVEGGQKQYNLTDLVKLKKCDIKDVKKRNKIVQIMQFGFQEVLKFDEFVSIFTEGKQLSEILKNLDFRHKYMLMIEVYLRMSGYMDTVAVMGNSFCFNFKSSKHTLCIFEIGVAPVKFHVILYELAYINIASQNLLSSSEYQSGLPEKAKFDPAVKIKID
jgi:hypothetical protein